MDLIAATELDVQLEGSVLFPAMMLAPTDDVERRALRGLIAAVIKPSTSVRFGRKGERRHREVDNEYQYTDSLGVDWPVDDDRWRGWCVSELSTLNLLVATRIVDMKGEPHLQYALLETEHRKELYRHQPIELWRKDVRIHIPEEVAAVSA